MNDKKALKAFKKIKKYCINTPCDLCIFNMDHIYNLDHKNYCYFFAAHSPCSWDVLRFESKKLDKRNQKLEQPDKCKFYKDADCCYPIEDCNNCPNHKNNIFGIGVSDTEFRQFIIKYLLGKDWYVVDSLGQQQINEIALDEILKKYSKRYRKECKKADKESD